MQFGGSAGSVLLSVEVGEFFGFRFDFGDELPEVGAAAEDVEFGSFRRKGIAHPSLTASASVAKACRLSAARAAEVTGKHLVHSSMGKR
ncbi:MAG TPA: hypothetical protein VNC50_00850 [Planctomycetia bacterium]|nr:hypothetical protein [Planctomycetia bacterium]